MRVLRRVRIDTDNVWNYEYQELDGLSRGLNTTLTRHRVIAQSILYLVLREILMSQD